MLLVLISFVLLACMPQKKIKQLTDLIEIASIEDIELFFPNDSIVSKVELKEEGTLEVPVTRVFLASGGVLIFTWDNARKQVQEVGAFLSTYDYVPKQFISSLDERTTISLVNLPSRKDTSKLYLGMSLDELRGIIGEFDFYGFGWDYGGVIISDKHKQLKNIRITLEVVEDSLQDKEASNAYEHLIGDIVYKSIDTNLSKLKVRVASIEVMK